MEIRMNHLEDFTRSMTEEKIVEEVKKYVRKKLEGEGSGHDWWHILRVWNLSKQIASHEKNVNMQILELSALLHDVADWKFYEGNDNLAPTKIKEILQKFDVDEKIINQVIDNVKRVGYRGGHNPYKAESNEAKIVQDADRLDAIGAIGIARCFAYGGHAGREIYNPEILVEEFKTKEEYRNAKSSGVNHFYEKLLKLKDLMNTKTAKKMAEKRHQYMEQFLEEFYAEWEAKR